MRRESMIRCVALSIYSSRLYRCGRPLLLRRWRTLLQIHVDATEVVQRRPESSERWLLGTGPNLGGYIWHIPCKVQRYNVAHIEDILFPVDLSESCRRTAPFVRSLASRTGARVTVLHVMELPQEKYADRPPLQSVVNVRSILRHRRHQIREFLVTELHSLPAAHFILRHGDPARIIVDYASKRNVDLIMMPTHGVGLFRRWLLGSVTAKVLHDAACPVWTNAHVQEAASWLNPDRCLKILCAVDLTEKSLCVMGYGAQLAQTFGAELQLVHVVPASESLTVKYFDTELVAALSETAREQASKLQNEAGTNAQVLIRSGDVGHVVGQAALERQADLIVIGRGVLQETLGRLRTESYSIIRDSPCPVLSV